MDIKVSVILPVYNVERYLEKCLRSVIEQTLADIEIIIVNDGTRDNSMRIAQKYLGDPRVKIITQTNKGLGFARNAGLRVARGEYICFIDTDDWLDKGHVKALYIEATRTNADVVIGSHYGVTDNARQVVPNYLDPKLRYGSTPFHWRDRREVLLTPTPVWDKLYKLSFLRMNEIEFTQENAEDIPFKWKTLTSASRISVVPEPYYYYRVRSSSLTGGRLLSIEAFRSHDIARRYLMENGLYDEVYPEWMVREVIELIYLTYKARTALLNDSFFFSAFYNLLSKAISSLDFNQSRRILQYISWDYLFRALYVYQSHDLVAFKNLLRRAVEVEDKRYRKLRLGRKTLSYTVSSLQTDTLVQTTEQPTEDKDSVFGSVTRVEFAPEYYENMKEHRAAFLNGKAVHLLPPSEADGTTPAVARLFISPYNRMKRIWFMAETYQVERTSSLKVLASVATEGSEDVFHQDTFRIGADRHLALCSIDIPRGLADSGFVLNLSVVAEDNFPAHYSGIRIFHFYADKDI